MPPTAAWPPPSLRDDLMARPPSRSAPSPLPPRVELAPKANTADSPLSRQVGGEVRSDPTPPAKAAPPIAADDAAGGGDAASHLGRLAALAGVRTEQQGGAATRETAALLEEAVSRHETALGAGSVVVETPDQQPPDPLDEAPPASSSVPPSSADDSNDPSPPNELRSQGTSPSSAVYAGSSVYPGTPATGYSAALPPANGYHGYHHPYSYDAPPPQQPAYYYATQPPPASYYAPQHYPAAYEQMTQRGAPPPHSPMQQHAGQDMPDGGPYYSPVSPAHPHAQLYSPPTPQLLYLDPARTAGPSRHREHSDDGSPTHYYHAALPPQQHQPYHHGGPPMGYYGLGQGQQQQQAYYPPHYDVQQRYGHGPPILRPAQQAAAPSNAADAPYASQAPPELARGHLAQSRLHDAAYNRPPPLRARRDGQPATATTPGGATPMAAGQQQRAAQGLPKPPPHSEFALWVGNVPGDSNHAELWRFFNSRSGPAGQSGSTGVESIHLISRSNCAFVNYTTQTHLDHAIAVTNGTSLRPGDPRAKDLVCRVRRREDDAKSGVGAQRGRGMHRDYVAQHAEPPARLPGAEPYAASHVRRPSEAAAPLSPSKESSAGGVSQASTASTSSGFLSRHFRKRYFILKSHTEDDLRLSQERGLWATQPHNEPVLDQAFRTAADGVYLVFSANKSGEFFGVARMAGPIFAGHKKSSSGQGVPQTVAEEDAPVLSSRMAASPQPLARLSFPEVDRDVARGASDPTPAAASSQSESAVAAPALASVRSQDAQRYGGSMPAALEGVAATMQQLSLGGHRADDGAAAEADGDGVIRRDTALTPEERNARLEQIAADQGEEAGLAAAARAVASASHATLAPPPAAAQGSGSGSSWGPSWGRPFKVEWLQTQRLPFTRTKHLRNAFNANREVRVARDGTEVEPVCGESLVREFGRSWAAAAGLAGTPLPASLPTSPRLAQR